MQVFCSEFLWKSHGSVQTARGEQFRADGGENPQVHSQGVCLSAPKQTYWTGSMRSLSIHLRKLGRDF